MTIRTDDVCVISVVVRDGANRGRILLGVRRPVTTSERHPDVLSTFTMRVPRPVLLAALQEVEAPLKSPAAGSSVLLYGVRQFEIGRPLGMRHVAVYLAEALLCRKLEVGPALVTGTLNGVLSPLGLAMDIVEDPKGGDGPERTVMLTYTLDVLAGLELLPQSSASYTYLEWVDAALLSRAVRQHDALILLPDANPFEVCLHGLCVRSAASLLEESSK